jgi:hypothetical protein
MMTLDLYNKALLWTAVTGLAYVVWAQARTGRHKYDTILRAAERHQMLTHVASALLLTGIAVASLYFFSLPSFISQNAPTQADTRAAQEYMLPDGSAMVVQVQGVPLQRPANGYGTWSVGGYTFSADSHTTIRIDPGKPVAACLVKHQDGPWQATFITPASDAPSC